MGSLTRAQIAIYASEAMIYMQMQMIATGAGYAPAPASRNNPNGTISQDRFEQIKAQLIRQGKKPSIQDIISAAVNSPATAGAF